MVIKFISLEFSPLQQQPLVTITMTTATVTTLRDRRKNKTKIALNGSQTLHFVKGTRTYGKEDAFSRSFRSWQDEEAMEITK